MNVADEATDDAAAVDDDGKDVDVVVAGDGAGAVVA